MTYIELVLGRAVFEPFVHPLKSLGVENRIRRLHNVNTDLSSDHHNQTFMSRLAGRVQATLSKLGLDVEEVYDEPISVTIGGNKLKAEKTKQRARQPQRKGQPRIFGDRKRGRNLATRQ